MADDNRPLKYMRYAIGEIILVVVGILIALSINNWNENRKINNQELVLLENLKLEMEKNLILIDDYIKIKAAAIRDHTKLLTYTNPEYTEKKDDSLAYKFTKIFSINNFKPENMVLEAAQNSNSIKLIRNEEIKKGLSKWEQTLKILMENDVFGNEHFNNSLIPVISNYYPFANIPYDFNYGNNYDQSKHKSELEKMFKSREFENSLYRMRNFHNRRVRNAEELKINTLFLIEYLNKELNIE